MKVITILYLILFFCGFMNAQNQDINTENIQGTTEEEYNYITKIYPVQVQSGITPDKSGYSLEFLHAYSVPSNLTQGNVVTVDYIGLYKEGLSVPRAIIAIANRHSSAPQYICIPHANTTGTIYEKCYNTLINLPASRKNLYFLGLESLYSNKLVSIFMEEQQKIEDNSEIVWTDEYKANVLRDCKRSIYTQLENPYNDPDIVCYCVLSKIMKTYKTKASMKGKMHEIVEMARDCDH